MKLWPQSLLWRTVLLLALLMVISHFVWFSIVRYLEREPRVRQLAQQAASIVHLTRTALLAIPPEQRRFFLVELDRQQNIRVYPAFPGDAVGRQPQRPAGRLLIREIQQRLGPDTQVSFGRRGLPGLWIRFRIENDHYWIALPRVRSERPETPQWLVWGTASLGFALVGAWLIAWGINRPVQALARAAEQIGKGEQPAPLAEVGSAELRALTRSFNRMSADLTSLNRERTLMLAGVSHDLRSPLARLRLAVEMLGEEHAARSGMVQDIEDMDAIIGQFLAFVRGVENEAPQRIDLNKLIAETVERYTRAGKPIKTILGELPELMVRPLAVQRMLSNLIDNAFHHGGSDVSVQTAYSEIGVSVSVLDRGPGIRNADIPAALQPFSRLNPARSGHAGAGLGLAIVERIVRMHDGRLDFLPRGGGGLEARVVLPT